MKKFVASILSVAATLNLSAGIVAHFPMDVRQGQIMETVGNTRFGVNGVHAAERVDGFSGNALRFDGYSTFVDANIGNVLPANAQNMSVSVVFAVETYPIVEIDVNTSEQVAIATCLDDGAKTGFGFFIGFDGKYSFKTYIGGWPVELKVDKPIQRYRWINLTAVLDGSKRSLTLYNNGEAVATSRANGGASVGAGRLRIGRSNTERYSGPFCLTAFNGVIDDISVWSEAVLPASADGTVDMAVSPARFADDPMRPTFHGMPGANWTNECHGMTYSDGRYHLFFQKNANGPYMSRLHWGHISSENLYDWREEPIAIAPGDVYDIKGCWSGCVVTDDVVTGGRPGIFYTGVDYAKAVVVQATPVGDDLREWKKVMPVINGRPAGLSDDFRDPYFFRNGENAYIIVGSGKSGIGTTTLHVYNPATGMWSNDGRTFFTGTDVATAGTFWEMPNVTRFGDRWLFTVTPLNTSRGVATLCWTGSVNADGTFRPDRRMPANVELPGFARDGYGLLSPTVCQHGGKTLALGIVPDKLLGEANYDLGYAHTYSLPREWTLDTDGNLVQRPFSGLSGLRCKGGYAKTSFTLDGVLTLDGVSGRAVELCGEFSVGAGRCGFTLLDDGASSIKVYYDGSTNEVVVDCRGLDRIINDSGIFDGYYRSVLPRQLAKGEGVKLDVFFDHSILDIFVNDTWASSVRVFARAKATENTTAFADGSNQVRSLHGWTLDAKNGQGDVQDIHSDTCGVILGGGDCCIRYSGVEPGSPLAVYDVAGACVFTAVADAAEGSVNIGRHGLHLVTVHTGGRLEAAKIVL